MMPGFNEMILRTDLQPGENRRRPKEKGTQEGSGSRTKRLRQGASEPLQARSRRHQAAYQEDFDFECAG